MFSNVLSRLDRLLYQFQGRAELRIGSWKRTGQSVWIAVIRGLHLDALKAGYAAGAHWDWRHEPMPHKPSVWAFRWTKGFCDAIWYRGTMAGRMWDAGTELSTPTGLPPALTALWQSGFRLEHDWAMEGE